jgi:hypothetical protein
MFLLYYNNESMGQAMSDKFFTRRIKATANTLRRVIADTSQVDQSVKEADIAQSYQAAVHGHSSTVTRPMEPARTRAEPAKLLILKRPLDHSERKENAFADIGEAGNAPAANSVVAPAVTNAKLMLMAENAVNTQLDKLGPERVQNLIEDIAPVRIANIFAENGADFVSQAVNAFAPEQISALVTGMAPSIIADEVSQAVSEKVAEHLASELPGGMEASVLRVVKEEMQGAFGYSITRKIRQLIHEEIRLSRLD